MYLFQEIYLLTNYFIDFIIYVLNLYFEISNILVIPKLFRAHKMPPFGPCRHQNTSRFNV